MRMGLPFGNSLIFAAIVTLLSWPNSSSAWAEGRLNWSVTMTYADPTSDFPRDLRFYSAPTFIDLRLSLSNATTQQVVVDQRLLRERFSILVTSGRTVPVSVEWPEDAFFRNLDGVDSTVPASDPLIVLESRESVNFYLKLHAEDRERFEPGTYTVTYEVKGGLSSLLTVNGGGRFTDEVGDGMRSIGRMVIAPPTSNPERSRMYWIEAQIAANRGSRADALVAYQRALDAAPGNDYILERIGYTHFMLKQYREASQIFERLTAASGSGGELPRVLALSYIGANDTASATRVIRASGVSEADLPQKLDELRRVLRASETNEAARAARIRR